MEINTITKDDLDLISDLSSRVYTGNSMSSNSTKEEKEQFDCIKEKLKIIAKAFKDKLDDSYGEFEVSVTTGNPISLGSTKLGRVWSGLYKGTEEKQYSAQISFVIDTEKSCLNVGFYFGRASSRSIPTEKKKLLEGNLKEFGRIVSGKIRNVQMLNDKFNSLFDYGFYAYSNHKIVTAEEWLNIISTNPKNSQIIYRIFPNDDGFIEFKTLDLYVSMVAFMMGPVPSKKINSKENTSRLPPEQRAKQAERRALIGNKGELFAFKKEKERLRNIGISSSKYPQHVALLSDSFGYDILSCDSDRTEVFIEVKTTTRTKNDPASKKFYISSNELEFSKKNPDSYLLYRVYDIEGDTPVLDVVNIDSVEFIPENYRVKILDLK